MSTYTSPMSLGGHTANMGAVLRISLVAAMGGFLFGYDSAVINGATGAMQEYFDVSPAPWARPWPPLCWVRPPARSSAGGWRTASAV